MTFMRSLMKIPKMVRLSILWKNIHTLRYSKIQPVHTAVYNTTPLPPKHDWWLTNSYDTLPLNIHYYSFVRLMVAKPYDILYQRESSVEIV